MRSIESSLNRIIESFYKENCISFDSPQLLALSGGCDSVALLVLLQKKCPYLQAAYFNHNLREENELSQEIEFIRSLTKRFSVPLHLGEVPRGFLHRITSDQGLSPEEVARKERYNFLNSIMENENLKFLVLAHHGSDQTETILSRVFQGSGSAGLSGIRGINGNRIRPLLKIPKDDLVQFLREKEISWSEDSSNREDHYQRNRIRNSLIPSIKEVFPGLDKSLLILSEKMSRIDHFLEQESGKIIWEVQEKGYSIDLNKFISLDPVIREHSLMQALDRLLEGTLLPQGKGRRVPYRFIKPLLDENLSATINLIGHGIHIFTKKGDLVLEKEMNSHDNFFFYLEQGKNYFFYPLMVEWNKIDRPDKKSVVLLLMNDEFPQVRSKGEEQILFESHRGVQLALWDRGNWHINKRNIPNPSSFGVIIRGQLKYDQ
jgi:tRNA(Ile)-lysidine synthase